MRMTHTSSSMTPDHKTRRLDFKSRSDRSSSKSDKFSEKSLKIAEPPWTVNQKDVILERLSVGIIKLLAIFPAFVTFGIIIYLLVFYLVVSQGSKRAR
jgi:hypothetical protein